MSPIRISVDLCESPLTVGGLLLGKYIVNEGSKGIKLTGEGASTTREEVVACLEDARSVVKSSFGGSNFDAAVVVVPNTTTKQHLEDIISYGRGHGSNITQVIQEHTAVSAAYVEKVELTIPTKLAIISFTGSLLEVSVVSIVLKDDDYSVELRKFGKDYVFTLLEYKSHHEAIDLEELKHQEEGSSGGLTGLVGGAVKSLILNPVEQAFNLLMNILVDLKVKATDVDKVVFVGKASRSEKMRQAVKMKFPYAVVWEEIDPEEVAAYGAAFASYEDRKFSMNRPIEDSK